MAITTEEQTAFRALIAWALDELDLAGRSAPGIRGIPPLTDARIDQYQQALDTHWQAIATDLGINLGDDATAYDAAPGWDTHLDTVRARCDATLGAERLSLWRHIDPRVTKLCRTIVLIVATALAWQGAQ